MIKINHFICPTCGHDFYADGAYATCDACQTFFYASASRTCELRLDYQATDAVGTAACRATVSRRL